ncbi:MAG: EAL domain-containing protein [Colwellia sp.]|nr:EAL domain-containing protein [Colwellia sp.]
MLGIAIGYLLLRYNTSQTQSIALLKWSEAKNNKSKNQLLNVINGAKLGYWDWNYKTGEHVVNSEWLSILGLSQQDITNHVSDWDKLIHPNDKEFMKKMIQTHIQSGKKYVAEFRMKHADGRWIWIQGSGAVVEYDEITHKPLRLSGIHQDISERKNNEEQMAVASLLLNESQQVGQLGGWKLDIKTGALFWTDETYRIHETSPEEFNPTVDAGVDFYLPSSKEVISNALDEAINQGVDFDLELETYTAKGKKIDVRATCIVTQEEGVPIRLTGIFQDISAQRNNQRKLEQSNLDLANANAALTLAASVFSHAGESIIITDIKGIIIDVNETFTTITGFSREEAIGQNPRILKSGRQSPEFYTEMWQTLQKEDYWTGEVWNRRKDGEVYAVMTTISAVRDEQGIVTHFVSLGNDITPMKEHQEQIERIAHYDVLTNLPNRVLLADRLSQVMLQCSRHEQSLGVAFLDLDGFKAVNDVHGHDMGDELLIALSIRMKEALRENDTLSRIGGDEFVAVLTDLSTVENCEPVLERLLLAASEPVTIDGVVLNVSASIGVTLYPQDNVDADLLLRHADQAMYVAKESGKNRYHLFDTAQDDAVKIQRESIKAIRCALDNHQFVLHYQPKVNMRTGTVTGVEALIRWQHPERGLLNPIEFLPVIENHAMMVEVGEWVIDAALTQISQWQDMGLNLPLSTSVNIAAVQLQQLDFTQRLKTLLAAHPDVKPHFLELEVLETSALDDVYNVSTIMDDCMAQGVSFALDDFGTGYSSLTYLRRLPANLIKIDQSFVRDMLIDADDLAIVEGVIALAKSFKRDVIAEGVETIEHGTALLQLGCELAQGYGIAKPMPASDIPAWIKDWKPDVSWLS